MEQEKVINQPLVEEVNEQKTKVFVENPFDPGERLDLEAAAEELKEDLFTSKTEVPKEDAVIVVDEKYGIFAKKNIHLVKAKPKSGKTTMLKIVLVAILKSLFFRLKSFLSNPKIVYFDDEQSANDTKRIITDIMKWGDLSSEYVDEHLKVFHLRKYFFDELRRKLVIAAAFYKPDVIILDGVVDLVKSFNDEVETRLFVRALMKLCDDYDCAIICVLHTNKAQDDHNPRGHLGTNAVNVSDTVLECEKRGDAFKVSYSESRHANMPDWHFGFNNERDIVSCDNLSEIFNKKEAAKEEDKAKKVATMLDILKSFGGVLKRCELVKHLESKGVGRTQAYNIIKDEIGDSIVEEKQNILIKENSGS